MQPLHSSQQETAQHPLPLLPQLPPPLPRRTVVRPSSMPARVMRTAISPRLAAISFLKGTSCPSHATCRWARAGRAAARDSRWRRCRRAAAAAANPGPGAASRRGCGCKHYACDLRCTCRGEQGVRPPKSALATMPRSFTQTGWNCLAPLPFSAAWATTRRARGCARAPRRPGRCSGSGALRAHSAVGACPLNPRLCMAAAGLIQRSCKRLFPKPARAALPSTQ